LNPTKRKEAGAGDFGAIGRSEKHSSQDFSGRQAEYRRVEGSSVAMRASWRELEVGLELVTKVVKRGEVRAGWRHSDSP
jgi:hypothetical protein